MRNERNPEISANPSPSQKNLIHFPRALARNEEGVYEYILVMLKGDLRSINAANDYIFSHLRSIMNNEMNTNTLKYASRVSPQPKFSSSLLSFWSETCTSMKGSSPISSPFSRAKFRMTTDTEWSPSGPFSSSAPKFSSSWLPGYPLIFIMKIKRRPFLKLLNNCVCT